MEDRTNYFRLVIAFSFVCIYTLILWGNVPIISIGGTFLLDFFKDAFEIKLSYYSYWVLASGVYFLLIPLTFGRIILKRSFKRMGFQWISVNNIKCLVIIYILSLPALIWFARQKEMYDYYSHFIKDNLWNYLIWTNLLMFFEHSFLHGVMISILEPKFFIKNAREITIEKRGNKEKNGWRSWSTFLKEWFHVDRYHLLIFLLDSIVFTLIHIGKPLLEVLFAFPAGIFLIFMAFKFKSFLPCYLIHVMTAGTIITILTIFK